MSDWHFDWQFRFPKENQEVLLSLGEIRHRADVLIGRTVVEFQRSNLSAKAFQDRNSFYTNLGYKVIWVFDLTERFASGGLRCEGDEKTFHWTKPNNALNTFQLRTGQTELFFQVRKDEEPCLVKVSDVPGRGLETFGTAGWYDKAEFLEYLGIRDGVCAPPEYDDLSENGAYQEFCKKYGICYKGSFYLNKKTVEIACKTVRAKNVTVAQALREQAKRFPKIRDNVASFDSFCRVGQHLKARSLLRHLDTNGYGAYLEKERMDRNAFDLLLELAAEDLTVPAFLKYLDTLKEQLEKHIDSEDGMILTTAHSAKGLEYDSVYIMDLYDGRFPGAPVWGVSGRKSDMDAGEEERRLFYVAMTRARNQLTLLTIRNKDSTFADIVCPLPKPQRPVNCTGVVYSRI